MDELEAKLPENEKDITDEQRAEMEELQKEYLELIKSFTGKSLDEIILIVAGELVDKQIADEKAAASTTTTVTAYKVGLERRRQGRYADGCHACDRTGQLEYRRAVLSPDAGDG